MEISKTPKLIKRVKLNVVTMNNLFRVVLASSRYFYILKN